MIIINKSNKSNKLTNKNNKDNQLLFNKYSDCQSLIDDIQSYFIECDNNIKIILDRGKEKTIATPYTFVGLYQYLGVTRREYIGAAEMDNRAGKILTSARDKIHKSLLEGGLTGKYVPTVVINELKTLPDYKDDGVQQVINISLPDNLKKYSD